ncbi:MAG: hypothetical protein AAGJ34_11965 [Pseudomonadota bacterium]
MKLSVFVLRVCPLMVFVGLWFWPRPATAEVCVVNQTPEPLYFAVATWSNSVQREVQPTSRVCVQGESSAEVVVSSEPEGLDGCEHLVQPGETELLLRFAGFGNCQWLKLVDDN